MQLHHGRALFRSGEMKQFFAKSRDLFLDCKAAGWIKPTVDGNRRTLFHIKDIVACVRRLCAEQLPCPPEPAKKPKTKKAGPRQRPAAASPESQ